MPESHQETQAPEIDPEYTASTLVIEQMRRLRRERGWSPQELAVRCEAEARPARNLLNRGRIYKLEESHAASVRVDELVLLARTFGVSLDTLLPGMVQLVDQAGSPSPQLDERVESLETKVDTIYRALGAAGIIELTDSDT